jgi:phenylalanyl-tRNA synthetase beta chain
METGRRTGILSDAQYRFARGVDPASLVPGAEHATRLILEICGGEASETVLAGKTPDAPPAVAFDPAYVRRLAGLDAPPERVWGILTDLGFACVDGLVQPPTWRPDIDGKADLVEEVARIAGYDVLPATPLPETPRAASGVLSARQNRLAAARRFLAAAGYQEAVTWSFIARSAATLFGGGAEALTLANPIAADLDCMRPSILPGLIEAAGRNARRGFPGATLFEIGPVFAGDEPADQRTVVAAIVAPVNEKRWDGADGEGLYGLKAGLMALLDEIGAPAASLQLVQDGAPAWWRPGRYARLQLGPKSVLAAFGEVHPRVLRTLDVEGPILAFEVFVDAIPEPKRKEVKTKPALALSPFMPLTRDFAFVVARDTPAAEVARAVRSADRALIAEARVFDVYEGKGVEPGSKSVAVEATLQPRERTLTEAEIEAVSARIIAAAAKAVGAKLRS